MRLTQPHRWSSRSLKGLFLLTLLPSLYFFVLFSTLCGLAVSAPDGGGSTTPLWWTLALSGLIVSLLLFFLLVGLYVWDVASNPRVRQRGQIPWLALFFAFGFVALPAYWLTYLHGSDDQRFKQ